MDREWRVQSIARELAAPDNHDPRLTMQNALKESCDI